MGSGAAKTRGLQRGTRRDRARGGQNSGASEFGSMYLKECMKPRSKQAGRGWAGSTSKIHSSSFNASKIHNACSFVKYALRRVLEMHVLAVEMFFQYQHT